MSGRTGKERIMNKEQWVEVLEASGVNEEGRRRWHREFEKMYPEGHQSFLQWLQLDETEIGSIREWSRG